MTDVTVKQGAMLTRRDARAGVRILSAEYPNRWRFYQNKRKEHRDFKWDHIEVSKAKRTSRKLAAIGISHTLRVCTASFGGGSYAQLRLVVPLDFSLTEARKPRDLAKRRKLDLRSAFAKRKRDLLRLANALRFGEYGANAKLNRALSALEDF